MAWPTWASRPWLGESSVARGPQSRERWRRRDDRDDRFSFVVKADPSLFELAHAKAREAGAIIEDEEVAPDATLVELEDLLGETRERPEPVAGADSFANHARRGLAPTFLAARAPRDDSLGPDADVLDPVDDLDSTIHGRFAKFGWAPKGRVHFGFLPRALALVQDRLLVLRNVRLRLSPAWFDDDGAAQATLVLPPRRVARQTAEAPPPSSSDDDAANRLFDLVAPPEDRTSALGLAPYLDDEPPPSENRGAGALYY